MKLEGVLTNKSNKFNSSVWIKISEVKENIFKWRKRQKRNWEKVTDIVQLFKKWEENKCKKKCLSVSITHNDDSSGIVILRLSWGDKSWSSGSVLEFSNETEPIVFGRYIRGDLL